MIDAFGILPVTDEEALSSAEIGTYINEIKINWAIISDNTRSATVKTFRLEDKDASLISTNIEKDNRKIKLDCKYDQTVDNRLDLYQEICDLFEAKELVTLTSAEFIENMAITNISNPISNADIIEFTIDLEQVEFAKIKREGEAAPGMETQSNKPSHAGVQGTQQSSTPTQAVVR